MVINTGMYRYFELKKDYKKRKDIESFFHTKETKKQKKIEENIKKENNIRRVKEIITVNKIYQNLRFFIRQDGTVPNFLYAYSNPFIQITRSEKLKEIRQVVIKEING